MQNLNQCKTYTCIHKRGFCTTPLRMVGAPASAQLPFQQQLAKTPFDAERPSLLRNSKCYPSVGWWKRWPAPQQAVSSLGERHDDLRCLSPFSSSTRYRPAGREAAFLTLAGSETRVPDAGGQDARPPDATDRNVCAPYWRAGCPPPFNVCPHPVDNVLQI